MSKAEQGTSNKLYLSIVGGALRQSVPEGTPGAIRRDWEAGGEKGVKHEIVFKAYSGKITNVYFYDGESNGRKFSNLNIVLDENEDGKKPVISVGLGTRYASDILKKLPNVDFEKEVRIRPYAFTPEGEDKTVTGVEITQPDNMGGFTDKIDSYFHFQDGAGKWKPKNGFPVPEGDTGDYTSDDWKLFYLQVRRFLVAYTKEHVCSKFADASRAAPAHNEASESGIEYPKDDIDPSDIPF
jgi:hypothetical protein